MRLFPETLESDLIESTEMVVKLQDIVESQAARIAELEAALQIAKHNEQYTHAANVNLCKELAAFSRKIDEAPVVAWMSPVKERLEFSRPDTVYGSHTIPLISKEDLQK